MPKMNIPRERYTHEQRNTIKKRMKQLATEGLSYDLIAGTLNREGFRTPSEKQIDNKFVSNFLFRARKRKKTKRAKNKRVKTAGQTRITAPVPPGVVVDETTKEFVALNIVQTLASMHNHPGFSAKQQLQLINVVTADFSSLTN